MKRSVTTFLFLKMIIIKLLITLIFYFSKMITLFKIIEI